MNIAIKRSLRNEVDQILKNSARIFLLMAVIRFFLQEKIAEGDSLEKDYRTISINLRR